MVDVYKIAGLAVGVIVIIALAIVYLTPVTPSMEVCGDGICSSGEGCSTCFADCSCPSSDFCEQELDRCLAPVCGNGICEPVEGTDDCCTDCGCALQGEVCTNNVCAEGEFLLTDEAATALVEEYFADQEIGSIEIFGKGTMDNEVVLTFIVTIVDDEHFKNIAVTNSGEVLEIPFFNE